MAKGEQEWKKNTDITPKIFAVNTLFNIPKSDAVV
jgi:hypothetical protein